MGSDYQFLFWKCSSGNSKHVSSLQNHCNKGSVPFLTFHRRPILTSVLPILSLLSFSSSICLQEISPTSKASTTNCVCQIYISNPEFCVPKESHCLFTFLLCFEQCFNFTWEHRHLLHIKGFRCRPTECLQSMWGTVEGGGEDGMNWDSSTEIYTITTNSLYDAGSSSGCSVTTPRGVG